MKNLRIHENLKTKEKQTFIENRKSINIIPGIQVWYQKRREKKPQQPIFECIKYLLSMYFPFKTYFIFPFNLFSSGSSSGH